MKKCSICGSILERIECCGYVRWFCRTCKRVEKDEWHNLVSPKKKKV
jgi:hypothetical protein